MISFFFKIDNNFKILQTGGQKVFLAVLYILLFSVRFSIETCFKL
jgi:hypothetical protein